MSLWRVCIYSKGSGWYHTRKSCRTHNFFNSYILNGDNWDVFGHIAEIFIKVHETILVIMIHILSSYSFCMIFVHTNKFWNLSRFFCILLCSERLTTPKIVKNYITSFVKKKRWHACREKHWYTIFYFFITLYHMPHSNLIVLEKLKIFKYFTISSKTY